MNKKLYVVMYGYVGDTFTEDGWPHSIYSSEAAARGNAALLEMPDSEEPCDIYAYVIEVDFYDQTAQRAMRQKSMSTTVILKT